MPHKKLPVINLPDTNIEKLLDKITIGLLVCCMFVLLAYYYPQLPEEVPTHFNGKGEVDKWGAKIEIWVLPILAAFLVGGMFFLYKIPHRYNYMTKITIDNAPYEYQRARLLLRMTSITMVLIFFVITVESCHVAIYNKPFLGVVWMVILILVLSFFPLFYYLIKQK